MERAANTLTDGFRAPGRPRWQPVTRLPKLTFSAPDAQSGLVRLEESLA